MDEIIREALSKGLEMHVAGEFDLAGKLYESVIKLQPNHADANHNMGLLKLDIGLDLEALPYLQTALQADTSIAQFWLSYIKALIKLERMDEASRILELAKESGFEGEEFVELKQRVNTPTKNAVVVDAEVDTPSPPQDKINQLVNLYNHGQLEAVVEQAKALTLQYPDALVVWNILGVAFAQTGQIDQAINAFKKVIAIKPDYAEAHNNMGNTLKGQGKLEEAIACYNKALSLKPDYAEACNNMGVALQEQGKLEEAIKSYNNAMFFKPDYADAHYNMGNALKDQGKLDEAIACYNKALSLKPDYAEACNNMGVALQEQGKLEEAIASFNKALSLKPDYAEAYYNIGNALKDQGKLDEAIASYNKALSLESDFAEAYYNIGNALKDQGKLEEAIESYNKAHSLKPDYAEAYNNKGVALQEQFKLDEAIASYNKALSLKSDYADAYNNMGRVLWLDEKFDIAFELMEWRWKCKYDVQIGDQLNSSKPKWNGEDQKKVFVWKEQGIGDEIMFSSILNELNKKSAKLIVECDKRLIPLYKRSFPKEVKILDHRNNVAEHEYETQIAIGSVLKHFRHNIIDFENASAGWLKADSRKSAAFQKKLQEQGNDKIIGISWFTKSKKSTSQIRNVPMKLLANRLQKMPATYVNLQYGVAAEEISSISSKYGLNLNYVEELDLFNDLDGQAALIAACDLVISTDNATVHMAGALGIDTRVLLPLTADERWGLKSSNSYWYDSVTLYRQEILDDWSKPLERLIIDLKNMDL